MSRGHLSCPRLAGCTPGVSPAPAHSHRPERRLPFSGLRAAGGRGRAEPNSIFSVLSCTNGIQLGKKKPQPSQSALKKLRARDIFPHPQRINALRGSCAALATSAEGPAGTEGQGDPVATNGAGSSPRPGSGPAVCGVRAMTVPARRGGRQTRPTRPPPVPDSGGDAPVTGPERAQLPPAARRLRALPQRRGHCPRPPGPGACHQVPSGRSQGPGQADAAGSGGGHTCPLPRRTRPLPQGSDPEGRPWAVVVAERLLAYVPATCVRGPRATATSCVIPELWHLRPQSQLLSDHPHKTRRGFKNKKVPSDLGRGEGHRRPGVVGRPHSWGPVASQAPHGSGRSHGCVCPSGNWAA